MQTQVTLIFRGANLLEGSFVLALTDFLQREESDESDESLSRSVSFEFNSAAIFVCVNRNLEEFLSFFVLLFFTKNCRIYYFDFLLFTNLLNARGRLAQHCINKIILCW